MDYDGYYNIKHDNKYKYLLYVKIDNSMNKIIKTEIISDEDKVNKIYDEIDSHRIISDKLYYYKILAFYKQESYYDYYYIFVNDLIDLEYIKKHIYEPYQSELLFHLKDKVEELFI